MLTGLRCTVPPLILVAAALGTSHGHAEDFTVVKSLKFSEDTPSLTLDLYLPEARDDLVPCVITIQGGGFLPQDGQRFKPFAEHLARNGFAAALISYRGRPEHTYRDTLEDVKASVRFVRRASAKYGIDPARIGATGRSAGGTLAGLLAVTGNQAEDDSRIKAAVCFAGVFDFVSRFSDPEQLALQPNHASKINDNSEWIGAKYSTTDKDWRNASAITHVDPQDPSILFLHCKDDRTVPWPQSRDMHAAMTEAGIASELRVYDTGGHAVHPSDAKPLDEMVAFFREKL